MHQISQEPRLCYETRILQDSHQRVRSARPEGFVVGHVHGLADDGFGSGEGAYGTTVVGFVEASRTSNRAHMDL